LVLELSAPGEAVGDEAIKRFIALFDGPLEPKAIAVIRAATQFRDERLSLVVASLARDELASQIDAATT
jgi:hypothetical protein